MGSSVDLIFSCCEDEVNDQLGRLCDKVVAVRHLERLQAICTRQALVDRLECAAFGIALCPDIHLVTRIEG